MAKKFFFVCVGVFLLALSYHLGADTATAEAPSKTVAAGAGEVAILSGALPSGATIPLPLYSDGTQAQESECHWFVSINEVSETTSGGPERERCYTNGRVITSYWCTQDNCGNTYDPYLATVNYMIIAVRASAPVSATQQSWGAVKARYR